MTTTILLARHGQTIWHRPNRYTGSSDVPLDDVGRRQADALGRWASGQELTALVHTDLQRSRDTAAPAAAATGLTAVEEPRLREVHFGTAEGFTMEQMDERDPHAAAQFRVDPCAHHWPGGEDPRAAVTRARTALSDLVRSHPGGRVLAVAHSTLIRLLVCDVMRTPLADYRRRLPALAPSAVTTLRLEDDGAAALLAYNVPVPA